MISISERRDYENCMHFEDNDILRVCPGLLSSKIIAYRLHGLDGTKRTPDPIMSCNLFFNRNLY